MTNAPRSITAGELVRLALVALFFLAAPTAGDIGSCNQSADDLDATKFFEAKQNLDCQRCTDCGLGPDICGLPCGPTIAQTFPKDCYPIVHDGEVCLDALQVASCEAYQSFLALEASSIPTECDFCPPRPTDGGIAQ